MKRLVIDLDDTICHTINGCYQDADSVKKVIDKILDYKKIGFNIIIYTSRNMRTYENNLGKINANTLPIIVEWLEKYKVPYDEIYVGKPWCGFEGFYVDDKAIRPSEFVSMDYQEIIALLEKEK
jgi:capsule biosynthesis phosphatase